MLERASGSSAAEGSDGACTTVVALMSDCRFQLVNVVMISVRRKEEEHTEDDCVDGVEVG